MIVKSILATKGGDVVSIEPTATLETAVHKLAEHRIGALLVLGPDNRVVGILSERDVVRVMAERGAGVLAEPLSKVMTRKVVTCTQTDTVASLMELMTTGKFRHIPVVEQERVLGVVSIGDIVKYRLREIEEEFDRATRLYSDRVTARVEDHSAARGAAGGAFARAIETSDGLIKSCARQSALRSRRAAVAAGLPAGVPAVRCARSPRCARSRRGRAGRARDGRRRTTR